MRTKVFAEKATKNVRTLWYASAASLVVYLAVPFMIPHSIPSRPAEFPLPIRPILWIIALVECGIVVWWKRTYLTPDRLANLAKANDNSLLVGQFVGRSVSGFAIAASIAVYGLVLALVGRHFWDQYLLTILAFLCLIYAYPPKDCFNEIDRRS